MCHPWAETRRSTCMQARGPRDTRKTHTQGLGCCRNTATYGLATAELLVRALFVALVRPSAVAELLFLRHHICQNFFFSGITCFSVASYLFLRYHIFFCGIISFSAVSYLFLGHGICRYKHIILMVCWGQGPSPTPPLRQEQDDDDDDDGGGGDDIIK